MERSLKFKKNTPNEWLEAIIKTITHKSTGFTRFFVRIVRCLVVN